MLLTHEVPTAVQRTAERALQLHRASPLDDVSGIRVAEDLALSRVGLDTVAKMHRFFAVNARQVTDEAQLLRTERDSAVIRSWHLHGAEVGRAWAADVYAAAVKEGYEPPDSTVRLLGSVPDEVYAAFQLGSWRFEYGLDPVKAARFVEEYHRASGWNLDLRRAFGESAGAVGNALYRRFHTPDPFREIAKALKVRDAEYRVAAQLDLIEMTDSLDQRSVDESLAPTLWTGSVSPNAAAKIVWAPFVAYMILAVEQPDLIVKLNKESKKPPLTHQTPQPYTAYHDAINTYVLYFHPNGARFQDPNQDPATAKQFGEVGALLEDLMVRAYYGRTLHAALVQKTLGLTRRWTAHNKLAGSLFHVFNADWKKGNWQHILDNIPTDADIRPAFEEFVKNNPMPSSGVKLQQSISDKTAKSEVVAFLQKGLPDAKILAVKINTTEAAKQAESTGTPLGVYAVIEFKAKRYEVLGAFKVSGSVRFVLRDTYGDLIGAEDDKFAASLKKGETTVVQAHKDMPGTKYGAVKPQASGSVPQDPEPELETALDKPKPTGSTGVEPTIDQIRDKFAKMYPSAVFEVIDLPKSFVSTVTSKYPGLQVPGSKWRWGTESEAHIITLVGALRETYLLGGAPSGDDLEHLALSIGSGSDLLEVDDAIQFVKSGELYPLEWEHVVKTPPAPMGLGQTVNPPNAPPLADPFKFTTNDVVKWSGLNVLIVSQSATHYFVIDLVIEAASLSTSPIPQAVAIESLNASATLVAGNVVNAGGLVQHLMGVIATDPQPLPEWGLPHGEIIEVQGQTSMLVGRARRDGVWMPVLLHTIEVNILAGVISVPVLRLIAFEDLGVLAESSYEPDLVAPEMSHEDDEPDPEQGVFELSGTPDAFKLLEQKGWAPAVTSESNEFKWSMGSVHLYGSKQTRTIIGYGFTDKGAPVYIHRTEKGNVNWVTCANAHKKYGATIGGAPDVLNDAQPKPGDVAKQKYPRLNYKLSDAAKLFLTQTESTPVNAPRGAAFHVGTPLTGKAGAAVGEGTLSLWIEHSDGSPRAVITTPGKGAVVASVAVIAYETVDGLDAWGVEYGFSSVVQDPEGEVVFGKDFNAEANTVITLPTGTLSPEPPSGWDYPAPLKQPPFPELPKGSHVSAGILVVIPAGTHIKVFGQFADTQYPQVVLYHPIGEFGGYKLNIPKGSVKAGESILKTAVREVWEETGLHVKPISYLGDYRGNKSITRLFVGTVLSGNPHKKTQPEESEAVRFVPLTHKPSPVAPGGIAPTFTESAWWSKLIPKSGNTWQQHAFTDLFAWMVKHGDPAKFTPAAGGTDDAVTPASSTPVMDALKKMAVAVGDFATTAGKTAASFEESAKKIEALSVADWSPNVPASVLYDDVWKTLYFKSPYPVTSGMVASLEHKVTSGKAAMPTSFDLARDREVGPKFGESFETTAGTPYIAAGYASWLGEDGKLYHFLLAYTPGGSTEAIACDADGYGEGHVSSDQTLANAPHDAWFQHDDPKINAQIKEVYETGSVSGIVSMQQFKTGWMKDAGLPAYAVVTTPILKDVASLFVPGAASEAQKDAVISCLKARMSATHSGKKGKKSSPVTSSPTASPSTPGPTSPMPGVQPKPKQYVAPGVFSPVHLNYVNAPQPHLFSDLQKSAGGSGLAAGSKPNTILQGPGGKWLAKWATGEDFRPHVDRSAYLFANLCKPNNVPVGVMEFGGKLVSFQPLAADAHAPIADPTTLSEANQAELLSQHAVDMYMGDHDGNPGNWLMVGPQLVAIDRGQAWKFVLMGQDESLDPHWHAPGNFGNGYAKTLLIRWSEGKTEIPDSAWAAMLRAIRKVQQVSDADLLVILQPVFDALKTGPSARTIVLKKLKSRRDSYEKDWTTTLKKLRKSFKWPEIGGFSAPGKGLQSSPEGQGFTPREAKDIADAVASGWQGKALRVGGVAIENQEVMVRKVVWEEKPGVKVGATMVHFRVARPAGLAAAETLFGTAGLELSEGLGGPQRLKVDVQNAFWEKIYAAIKTINHHLGQKKDLDVNLKTVGAAQALKPALEGLVAKAADATALYTPTSEPNEAVYAMAEQYLQYVGIIEYWIAHKEELLGQHTVQFVEFLWEDPPDEQAEEVAPPPYKVSLKKQGALWPTANPSATLTHITNLNKPVMNSAHQSQFVIEDPVTKAKLFWNPPGSSGIGGLKDGVESLKGQGWGLIPGDPTPETVAHLFKLFESATGVSMKAAKAEDTEALFWSKQHAILQEGGAPTPKADSTLVKEPEYEKGLGLYASGDAAGAIQVFKKAVASKLNKTVAQVEAEATPLIEGAYTRGAGYFRHQRLGWDRARLAKTMGSSCHVAHHLADDVVSWMQQMLLNGALIANSVKPYYGVTKTGASPGSDMQRGGGQGLFCCFRKGFSNSAGMIYFDISLALRLDLYIVGTGDTFGDTKTQRYYTPEQWVGLGAHTQTGTTGASSALQVNVRHDIDLQEYLVRVACGNATARGKCIKMAESVGWTFYGGASPEQVFVA